MRFKSHVEWSIRKIKKSLKKVGASDLKTGDRVFFRRDGDESSTPFEIAVDEGGPHLARTNVGVNKYLNPNGELFRVGPKHLKSLYILIEELDKFSQAEARQEEERKREQMALHQRYVVWNYVHDFEGVEDRDGFLVEVFDGRGKLILRTIWCCMEVLDRECGVGDIEEFAVKMFAHWSMAGERIKPVIVFCDKID